MRPNKLFFTLLISVAVTVSAGAKSEEPIFVAIKVVGTSYERFKEAFDKSWRKFGLDTVPANLGEKKAAATLEPLQLYDLRSVCEDLSLYWLDLSEFHVKLQNGKSANIGPSLSQPLGARGIVFGLDFRSKKLARLMDERSLILKGYKLTKGCPVLVFNQTNTSEKSKSGPTVLAEWDKTHKKYKLTQTK